MVIRWGGSCWGLWLLVVGCWLLVVVVVVVVGREGISLKV